MSCICLYMLAVYLLFLPPLISGRPRCCRRLHRHLVRLLRRRPYPYRRASRQAEPFSSPDIAYLSVHFLHSALLLQPTTPPLSTTTTSTTLPLPSSFQASRAILFPRYRLSFRTFLALGIAATADYTAT